MTSSKARDLPALVFDLDGTLIDSLPDLCTSLNALLVEEGRPALAPEQVRRMIGDGAMVLIERGFTATGGMPAIEPALLLRRFLAHYEPHAADSTTAWPGVAETLSILKERGHKLAVCTNKPHKATMFILDRLGLAPLFDFVVGGDSTPAKKPDPAPLFAAIDGLDLPREQAIMVGDSANDVQAARNGGIRVIVVSFGYTRIPAAELGADLVIDDFASLPEALSRLA